MQHRPPDRVPVDFMATPEIWEKLAGHFGLEVGLPGPQDYFSPEREAILRRFEIDCRVISYDMFCRPPDSVMRPAARLDWWTSLARSTPGRMWRQLFADGSTLDVWGHHIRAQENTSGSYEEFASWPLQAAQSLSDLAAYPWPEPDWWDFSTLQDAIARVDPQQHYHWRFRAGSVFETAWQLRGMQEFLVDLAAAPEIPRYMMDRITEVIVENTRQALDLAGERIDMVYFYDDVGAQENLLISKGMWRRYIRPCHARIIEVAHAFGKPVMYHCDGAIYPLMNELIDLGVDVLNPIQPSAKDMAPGRLKAEFGERLCFHGGIDIQNTLPRGTQDEVRGEVRERVRDLGENGGYILCSSHHIQSDTPLENVLAMYDTGLR
jgi:uroporphyrinogen decarboxylase